jgi:hypothetical protein
MILFDPPALSDQINKLFQEKAVRLIHLLKEGEYRPDVASTMIGIGEAVLGNYKPSEFPIRRMR